MTTRNADIPAWAATGERVAIINPYVIEGAPSYAVVEAHNRGAAVIAGKRFRPEGDQLVHRVSGRHGGTLHARRLDDPSVVEAEHLTRHRSNANGVAESAERWLRSVGRDHRNYPQDPEVEQHARGLLVASIVAAGLAREVAAAAGLNPEPAAIVGAPVPLQAVPEPEG